MDKQNVLCVQWISIKTIYALIYNANICFTKIALVNGKVKIAQNAENKINKTIIFLFYLKNEYILLNK